MPPNSSAAILEAERLFRGGQAARAEQLLRASIAADGRTPRAFELLAYIRGNANDLAECEALLGRAVALPGCSPEAMFYLGRVQLQSGNARGAAASFENALGRAGPFFEGLHELGVARSLLGEHAQALDAFRRAERLQPRSPELQSNIGDMLAALRQFDAAVKHYDLAVSLEPRFVQAWTNRGTALTELGDGPRALESYDRALALEPNDVTTLMNRATTLVRLKRDEEAHACFETVARLAPELDYLAGHRLHAAMQVTDWRDFDAQVRALAANVDAGRKAATPFVLMGLPIAPQTLTTCTRTFMRDRHPAIGNAGLSFPAEPRDSARRLRVAYFSTDFRQHATAQLLTRVLECHDRSRFEWFGFSLWPHPPGEAGERMARALDHFEVVAARSDADIARIAREARIDIAVDLNGLTEGMRPDIFAHRAAPLQVNFLGYPGTMGADYIDYILADRVLVTPSDFAYYTEKVVQLPGSYQPNDDGRPVGEPPPREACGLPAGAFVFACFNNTYKITPDAFDVWMRIMKAVPGSVLWLLATNGAAQRAIEAEAERRGVDAARIVWANRVALLDHLARHAHADLFLDTFHYNAHTTASDALWAGLPLLTLAGRTFAARVGASLLRAIDLPELVVDSVEAYESLAVQLARSPERLAPLRQRLAGNRRTMPVFDSPRFARHLESAYRAMWNRRAKGLPPDHLQVEMDGGQPPA